MMNSDEPIDGPECMYDLRRLAHLAVKWVVISSFDSAERKEREPIRFSGSQDTPLPISPLWIWAELPTFILLNIGKHDEARPGYLVSGNLDQDSL